MWRMWMCHPTCYIFLFSLLNFSVVCSCCLFSVVFPSSSILAHLRKVSVRGRWGEWETKRTSCHRHFWAPRPHPPPRLNFFVLPFLSFPLIHQGVNFDDILSAPLVDVFARTMAKVRTIVVRSSAIIILSYTNGFPPVFCMSLNTKKQKPKCDLDEGKSLSAGSRAGSLISMV